MAAFIPPTPGPVAVAGLLGADLARDGDSYRIIRQRETYEDLIRGEE